MATTIAVSLAIISFTIYYVIRRQRKNRTLTEDCAHAAPPVRNQFDWTDLLNPCPGFTFTMFICQFGGGGVLVSVLIYQQKARTNP